MKIYKTVYWLYFRFFKTVSSFYDPAESAKIWLSFAIVFNLILIVAFLWPGLINGANFFWIFLGGYFIGIKIQKTLLKKLGASKRISAEMKANGVLYKKWYGILVVSHLILSLLALAAFI